MFLFPLSTFGLDPEDPAERRERSHRIALNEARMAERQRDGSHNDFALADGWRALLQVLALHGGLHAPR